MKVSFVTSNTNNYNTNPKTETALPRASLYLKAFLKLTGCALAASSIPLALETKNVLSSTSENFSNTCPVYVNEDLCHFASYPLIAFLAILGFGISLLICITGILCCILESRVRLESETDNSLKSMHIE